MSNLDSREEVADELERPGMPGTDTDWAAELSPRPPARRRTQVVLAAVVLLAAGFIGGIVTTQQLQGQDSSVPGGMALPDGIELPEGFEPPTGAGGGGGGTGFDPSQLGATAGGSTTYTVTVVDGGTLYVKDGAGSTVKVVTLPTTKVRKLAKATTSELRPGDTVTIAGDTDDLGTILAEVVAQTE